MKNRITTPDYSLFDLVHPVLPTRLNLEDFCKEFAKLYKNYSPLQLLLMRLYVWLNVHFISRVPYDRKTWREVFKEIKGLSDPRNYLEDLQKG